MVFTRRNLRQIGIRPDENTADLLRSVARVPRSRSRSSSVASQHSVIHDALYNSDSSSQLSAGSVNDWFENLTPPQQDRLRRWIKRYRTRDVAHRHRIDDDQPKEEQVRSYTRRRA